MRADEMFNKMVRFKKNGENDQPDIEAIKIGAISKGYKMDDWLQLVAIPGRVPSTQNPKKNIVDPLIRYCYPL